MLTIENYHYENRAMRIPPGIGTTIRHPRLASHSTPCMTLKPEAITFTVNGKEWKRFEWLKGKYIDSSGWSNGTYVYYIVVSAALSDLWHMIDMKRLRQDGEACSYKGVYDSFTMPHHMLDFAISQFN